MPVASKVNFGNEIIARLEGNFGKYLALERGLPFVLALWTLATHTFDCFDAFAYLAITSPTKRCGKTRLGELVELASCNGLRIVGATAPVIFRSIQLRKLENETLTLIIDEAEALGTKSERSDSVREVLNAGYRRGQCVRRCERDAEDGFAIKEFDTFCPKVIILIGNLPDTIADRSIPINMLRRKPGETVERFFYSQATKEAKRYRKESQSWAKSSRRAVIRNYRHRDLHFLEDREAELWLPLFAVCAVACPHRVEELRRIAQSISSAKQAGEPAEMGCLLLRDIREVFAGIAEDAASTDHLISVLRTLDESPWDRWSKGAGLDSRALARLLRPFKIGPHNPRLPGDRILKGYERSDFEEAWARYLPARSPATPLQAAPIQEKVALGDPLQPSGVADAKALEKPG
jgi:Protein of unknown function (DUF3631)